MPTAMWGTVRKATRISWLHTQTVGAKQIWSMDKMSCRTKSARQEGAPHLVSEAAHGVVLHVVVAEALGRAQLGDVAVAVRAAGSRTPPFEQWFHTGTWVMSAGQSSVADYDSSDVCAHCRQSKGHAHRRQSCCSSSSLLKAHLKTSRVFSMV